jgi:hypothetical protein|tara:strand:- start:2928 stop:3206 length:279 start_codon:yes stop_codon:yes gene_type:complete
MRFNPLLVLVISTCMTSPLQAQPSPMREMPEQKFLDQVEAPGHVLISARGAMAVNAEARRQGLTFPAVGYWSPENVCFSNPPKGDCNGLFRR